MISLLKVGLLSIMSKELNYGIYITNQTDYHLNLEKKYGAHDYHPLPVVLAKGEGSIFGMLKEKSITIFYRPIRR